MTARIYTRARTTLEDILFGGNPDMKKMTIDGNTAAAHIAYAFSDVAATPSLRRHLWRKTATIGQDKAERIFSATFSKSLKCNPKRARQAQFTALWQQAH